MVLVWIEHNEGNIKKASLEGVSFAVQLAKQLGVACEALVVNDDCKEQLCSFDLQCINRIDAVVSIDTQQFTSLIASVFKKKNANYLVLAQSSLGKAIAGRLSIRLKIGLMSGVVGYSIESGQLIMEKNVFSGKAKAKYTFGSEHGIIAILPNSLSIIQTEKKDVPIEFCSCELPDSKVELVEKKLIQGVTPLPEASIVVSAGRGMKDPSNWGMIEELASHLGATLACSRPVADAGWRPHHEHVGQTGIAIRPKIYIAIGISGAIQHLAGVNNSGTIIVINKDPEAAFFKAADYGICGDLFDIIPKLNVALQELKM